MTHTQFYTRGWPFLHRLEDNFLLSTNTNSLEIQSNQSTVIIRDINSETLSNIILCSHYSDNI